MSFVYPKMRFGRKRVASRTVIPCPTNCTAENWIKIIHGHLPDFLRDAFPDRKFLIILLGGEAILHTDDAVAALAEYDIRLLPDWPPNSPDLNPQENVWVGRRRS